MLAALRWSEIDFFRLYKAVSLILQHGLPERRFRLTWAKLKFKFFTSENLSEISLVRNPASIILLPTVGKPLQNIRCGKSYLNVFYLGGDLELTDTPFRFFLLKKYVRNVPQTKEDFDIFWCSEKDRHFSPSSPPLPIQMLEVFSDLDVRFLSDDLNHQRENFLWSDCPDFIELLFLHSDWMSDKLFACDQCIFCDITLTFSKGNKRMFFDGDV